MKSGLILIAVAGVLFALTAGLSLWLNPLKSTDDTVPTTKTARKESGTARDKEDPWKTSARATPRGDDNQLGGQLKDDMLRLAQREEDLDRQKSLHRFLLDDVRDEMEDLQKLIQKSAADTKRRTEPAPDGAPPKPPATDPKSKPPTTDKPKSDNSRAVTSITESMAPENAARVLEQLARSGKVDAAVQLLAKMSPRQAAKVLAAITDEKLSGQLFEKLAETQPPPPAGKP